MHKVYQYIVWFIATLFVVYSFCLNTAAAVFSEVIKDTLNASNFQVSIAVSTFILGFACMQIPAGYLLDKFNSRYVVSGSILLLGIGNILISYSNTVLCYALSNFLQGVGASFAFIAAAILIAQWFPEKKFPIMFGFTQALSCILTGIIHYYFTIALTSYSWNIIYRCLAVFGFILFLFAIGFVNSPANWQRKSDFSLKNSLVVVLSQKQIILCSIAAATSFGVLLSYAGLWYLKIQNYYNIENLQAVLISGMVFLGIGIGTPFWGFISNKVNSRLLVIQVTLCIGTMILLMGIYLPHFQIKTLIIIKCISFLIGFFLSGSMLFYTMVSEISTDSIRGVALSVLNTAVFIFNTLLLFLPYLFLTIISTNFFTYLWILPFFILFSILLLYFVKETISGSK